MDLFKNFWYLLTTENLLMCKLLLAPTILIEAYLVLNLITSILKISYNKNQKNNFIIFYTILILITEFILPTPWNTILCYLLLFLIIKLSFNLNSIKTLIAIILPAFIFALVGNLILNPILKILSINSSQLNLSILYRAIYLIIVYSLVFIILVVFKKVKVHLKIFNNLDNSSKKIVYINLLLGILAVTIQLIITFYYINTYSLIFTLLNFISLFAYFFISIYSLIRIMELFKTNIELETAESYNATLTYLYDNVKAFKHDFNNMIFIIGGYIENNDINGLKKYFFDLENDCERVNKLEILNPKVINNPGVYNLLVAKYNKAKKENLKISFEFFFDLEKLKMPIYEFSRILGILLDNAIEAAATCDDKQVNLFFRDSSSNQTQIIKIENTYTNKNIDTSKIFAKGISEKQNHMGMGLWEVQQILKRNNNVNLITSKNENYFIQQLEIYY